MLSILMLALQSAPSFSLERYEIDARSSTIGFDGTSPVHDFTGKTHAITGDLRADLSDGGRIAGGAVWIETRTLDTDNSSRDKEMRELLGAQHFPQIVFQLDSVHATRGAGKDEYTAEGRFTIKGIEKARVLRFHVEPVAAHDGASHDLRVLGELRFNMTDHGIERPGILIAKVADEVRVWLDLRLHPVADVGVESRVRTLHVEEEFTPMVPEAAARKFSGTEYLWTSGATLVWDRRADPSWILGDAHGVALVDPRTGAAKPANELFQRAMEELSKSEHADPTWTSSVEESHGRRTLRITFAEETSARMPTWALDPAAWTNGPTRSAPH